jgi:hypothetical protein
MGGEKGEEREEGEGGVNEEKETWRRQGETRQQGEGRRQKPGSENK